MTGCADVSVVIENLEKAVKSGVRVKINSILQKGINDREWESLVNLAENRRMDVRFIEMMPIGCGKKYEAIRGEEVLWALKKKYPLAEKELFAHGNGPAVYYRIPGFSGSIGFINAVHGQSGQVFLIQVIRDLCSNSKGFDAEEFRKQFLKKCCGLFHSF